MGYSATIAKYPISKTGGGFFYFYQTISENFFRKTFCTLLLFLSDWEKLIYQIKIQIINHIHNYTTFY